MFVQLHFREKRPQKAIQKLSNNLKVFIPFLIESFSLLPTWKSEKKTFPNESFWDIDEPKKEWRNRRSMEVSFSINVQSFEILIPWKKLLQNTKLEVLFEWIWETNALLINVRKRMRWKENRRSILFLLTRYH